jgi:VanZ family protein
MDMKPVYIKFAWLFSAIVFAAVVLVLTHLPPRMLPKFLPGGNFDKVEHFTAYGVMSFLFLMAVKDIGRRQTILLVIAGILLIGGIDELTQPWAGRSCDIFDWMFDLFGLAAACAIVRLISIRENRLVGDIY